MKKTLIISFVLSLDIDPESVCLYESHPIMLSIKAFNKKYECQLKEIGSLDIRGNVQKHTTAFFQNYNFQDNQYA